MNPSTNKPMNFFLRSLLLTRTITKHTCARSFENRFKIIIKIDNFITTKSKFVPISGVRGFFYFKKYRLCNRSDIWLAAKLCAHILLGLWPFTVLSSSVFEVTNGKHQATHYLWNAIMLFECFVVINVTIKKPLQSRV